jgi:hypothetical protein
MNYISEILTNNYTNQGIQDVKICYDSVIFNVKVKNNNQYFNFLLIEKIKFDYDNNEIIKTDNGIIINFGDTEHSQPFKTKGNGFLSCFLEKKNKKVLLVGIKQTDSGNTIPVVYSYDINDHSYQSLFPSVTDLQNFESFNNFEFDDSLFPTVNFTQDKIYICFKSKDINKQYLNTIILKNKNHVIDVEDYEIFSYDKNNNMDFKNYDEKNLIFSYNSYMGFISKSL